MEIPQTIRQLPPSDHVLGKRFSDALVYASIVHGAQRRKGSDVPYLGHLLGVASILIDVGATEDEAIAGLLHDTVEDQGGLPRLQDILVRFGETVAELVLECSDAAPSEGQRKGSWHGRKAAYRERLQKGADKRVYLISAADKLHNLRTMWSEYGRVHGDLWLRFSASPEDTVDNYERLNTIYAGQPADPRREAIVNEISSLIRKLRSTLAATNLA